MYIQKITENVCVHTTRKLYCNVDCNATNLDFIDNEILRIITILYSCKKIHLKIFSLEDFILCSVKF